MKTLNSIAFRLKPYGTPLLTGSHLVQCLNYYPLNLTELTSTNILPFGIFKAKESIPEESWLLIPKYELKEM